MSTPSGWQYFSAQELTCPCGCRRMEMDRDFMARLVTFRRLAGIPLRVTSGFRCPEHNAAVSSTGLTGPHTTGQAVDIAISGPDLPDLIALALQQGFTGFGFRQHGALAGRFIHLDDLSPRSWPRPRIWTYS